MPNDEDRSTTVEISSRRSNGVVSSIRSIIAKPLLRTVVFFSSLNEQCINCIIFFYYKIKSTLYYLNC